MQLWVFKEKCFIILVTVPRIWHAEGKSTGTNRISDRCTVKRKNRRMKILFQRVTGVRAITKVKICFDILLPGNLPGRVWDTHKHTRGQCVTKDNWYVLRHDWTHIYTSIIIAWVHTHWGNCRNGSVYLLAYLSSITDTLVPALSSGPKKKIKKTITERDTFQVHRTAMRIF